MSSYWKRFVFIYSALLLGALAAYAVADERKELHLPPGPIKERHELMEGVGKNAERIGNALKANKPEEAAAPAEAIAGVMEKFTTLFPPGSTHPDSRAKPEIWKQKEKFDQDAADMRAKALAFADVAKSGGDAKAASRALWGGCKTCHESFRVPKPGE